MTQVLSSSNLQVINLIDLPGENIMLRLFKFWVGFLIVCMALLGDALPIVDAANTNTAQSDPQFQTNQVTDMSRWMEQLGSSIKDRQLNKLVIPGTHDSGTYSLQIALERPYNDPFAPDGSTFVKIGSLSNVAVRGWGQAQARNIAEQLNDGIRALDFRPCVEKSGTIRICHGLYGPPMSTLLSDVRSFVAQHPKEIVILNVQNFSQWGQSKMSDEKHVELVALIKQYLDPYLIDHTKLSPTSTIGDIWTTGRSVVVVYHKDDGDAFWTQYRLTDSWDSAVWAYAPKLTYLDHKIRLEKQARLTTLFDLSAAATPEVKLISAGIFYPAVYPESLKELAAMANPVILQRIANDWSGEGLNIISMDHYQDYCLVKISVRMNGASNISIQDCYLPVYTRWAHLTCPNGYREDGLWCGKPDSYGRGAGYISKSLCEKKQGAGNCEKYIGLWYPKCASGYKAVGSNICSPTCPYNMIDVGVSCQK
jgi:hypothetical protein